MEHMQRTAIPRRMTAIWGRSMDTTVVPAGSGSGSGSGSTEGSGVGSGVGSADSEGPGDGLGDSEGSSTETHEKPADSEDEGDDASGPVAAHDAESGTKNTSKPQKIAHAALLTVRTAGPGELGEELGRVRQVAGVRLQARPSEIQLSASGQVDALTQRLGQTGLRNFLLGKRADHHVRPSRMGATAGDV